MKKIILLSALTLLGACSTSNTEKTETTSTQTTTQLTTTTQTTTTKKKMDKHLSKNKSFSVTSGSAWTVLSTDDELDLELAYLAGTSAISIKTIKKSETTFNLNDFTKLTFKAFLNEANGDIDNIATKDTTIAKNAAITTSQEFSFEGSILLTTLYSFEMNDHFVFIAEVHEKDHINDTVTKEALEIINSMTFE